MQTAKQKIASAMVALYRLKRPGYNAAACKRYYYARKARQAGESAAAAA
jgi:hypothetical protein